MKDFIYRWHPFKLLAVIGLVAGWFSPVALAQPATVCASVVIQIAQKFTLERQGFQAQLGITNGLPSSLDNFQVTLNFTDASGNPVQFSTDAVPNANGMFYYRVQTGYTLPSSVAAGASQNVAFLIVPAPGAAGNTAAGSIYYIGATVTYSVNGVATTVQIAPDFVTVQPMPLLQLQYFLPGDVYGLDPTNPDPAHQPAVPFALGIRVINHSSFATAKAVTIQSAQPQIIDNEHGLLVDFSIIGCQVNGAAALPSLQVGFGDIPPLTSAVGNWLMTCSLSGRFVQFSAEISHDPELGGELTSLIPQDQVSTHRLISQVLVDLPGRDGVLDFLATDAMSGDITTPLIYESDNDQVSEPVDYFAPGSSLVSLTGDTNSETLSANVTSTMMYVRAPSLFNADKIVHAVRSDGKILPAANCWISKDKNNALQWEYWLNLFDTNKQQASQTYALTFADPPAATNPPVLTIIGGQNFQVLPGQPLTIKVAATDPNNLIPALATGSLPDGAVFTDNKDGTGSLVWTPAATQLGTYAVQFKASLGLLSATKSANIEVTSQLTTTFGAWQANYWPGVTDPNIIGPNANPSGDGLNNLLKYALGGDPTVPDDSILPVVGMDVVAGQHFLTLTYRQLQGDPTLLYEVVASNDLSVSLANWTVQTQTETTDQSAAPAGFVLVKIIDSVPVETGTIHRFLKLRVTQTSN